METVHRNAAAGDLLVKRHRGVAARDHQALYGSATDPGVEQRRGLSNRIFCLITDVDVHQGPFPSRIDGLGSDS